MTGSLTLPARLSTRHWILIALGLVAVQIAALFALGRVPICTCGTVKLWQGVVNSSENSQHLFDWYTPSHVLHGVLLYAGLRLVFPNMPVMQRFALALGVEVAWEILENTPLVIERYRSGTISLGYQGDSIVNSVADTIAMSFGFLLAARLPVLAAILFAVALELVAGFFIRDNLTLNVLMLLHPLDSVREWQAALPNR
ncbi:MAG: DUF2585 domain-containing protein [Pseudorhodoplanes sp.]